METTKPSFWNRQIWKSCDLTPKDRRNQTVVLIWLFLWALVWVGANIAIKEDWVGAGPAAVLVTALSTLIGVVMMIAYWRFVRQADELQQRIQLEALALGFGAGLVCSWAYRLLERAGAFSEVDVSFVAAIMMFAYAAGIIIGRRRYA